MSWDAKHCRVGCYQGNQEGLVEVLGFLRVGESIVGWGTWATDRLPREAMIKHNLK